MTRKVYDSTTARDIPDGIPHDALVAGYVDGMYVTYPALATEFPRHTRISITVNGTHSANVIDCEAGDVSPERAAVWARAEHDAGKHPTIYMPESLWELCRHHVRALGLNPDRDVSWWVAWYGHPDIPAGAVACQNVEGTRAHHWDESLAHDYWPGVDPPHPAPTPQPDNWTERMIHKLPTLARGAHNANVRTIQGLLQARGYQHVDIDGLFGPTTEDAVRALQLRDGIRHDGIVGQETWTALVTGAKA